MSKILGMDGTPASGGAPQLNFDILAQPTIKCEVCEDVIFESVMVFKKVNKVLIGAPHDQAVPFQLFRCVGCGSICTDTLPDPKLLDKILGADE